MIKEAGEVEEKIVVHELFSEARTQVRILSSVEGLRQMVSFPFSAVRNLAVKISAGNSAGMESKKERVSNEEN